MPLPLHERALDPDSEDLVRLTVSSGQSHVTERLIPAQRPEPGEQYRFHFDMTRCIGCRSCEVACNEQNGNPASIRWRRVGELEGGVYPNVQRTYLSMGCNQCLSADCLRGCPVDAYTKDPVTGIVLHSAEACIGCQYCVWNCPYSVPQFNPERGVVGKCDMCRNRLLDDLEPACVNACPENAIQIEIVNQAEWRANYTAAESPGLPPAGQTISTTRVTLPAHNSAWLARVDTGNIPREHAHPSLVLMTTAMQATFGTLAVLTFFGALDTRTITLLATLTALALSISVFHLGRPLYAWRAMKMWRRSWLSREVLLFSVFFAFIGLCATSAWAGAFGFSALGKFMQPFAITAVVFGLAGTVASSCIYLVKARPAWNTIHTPLDFLLSSALIGLPIAAAMEQLGLAPMSPGVRVPQALLFSHTGWTLVAAGAWVSNHVVRLLRLRASSNFESRASYNHLRGESLWWVVGLSWLAALATPLFVAAPLPLLAIATAVTAVLLGRYLFFVSVVPLSMGLTFLRHTAEPGGGA